MAGITSREQIAVGNDSANPLPVEISIARIRLDENGNLVEEPAGEEFQIFPRPTVVPPRTTQNFRVQWFGDPRIKTSQSYIFSVTQVATKMPEWQSGVQLVLSFAIVVNIAPMAGNSALTLLKSGVANDDEGKRRPTVTVQNSGNIHAKLTDATITLSGGGWSKTLTPAELRHPMGIGLVQPGKTRRFLLPIEIPPNVRDVTASISYKPTK